MIAFDECSILHMFKFKIPPGFVKIYGEYKEHKNCSKLLNFIKSKGEKPYRFIPGLKGNYIHVIKDLVSGENSMMGHVFKNEIKKGIEIFWNNLSDWGEIPRSDNFSDVKQFFIDNEKNLKKEFNIPEDEDCSIIAGYRDYKGENKILVSEDEHFWGYKDLIFNKFEITIIEEWNV
jgi:hypothetical protein